MKKALLLPVFAILLGFLLQNCNKVEGCTDYTARNFNPYATVDDESCESYVYGCTDRNAINYDPHAEFDDGKCAFPDGYVPGTLGGGKK